MIKLSDYVLQRLRAWGGRHIFLVTGGGAMHHGGGRLQFHFRGILWSFSGTFSICSKLSSSVF
jgi:hypothetical protein